jgi:hypothetical protein
MTHEPSPRTLVPVARVGYSSRLFQAAADDSRGWLARNGRRGLTIAIVSFLGLALLVWLVRGGEAEFLVPALAGVVSVLLWGIGLFATHLLYLSPRKLCATKQQQLDAERRKFAAALEKEKQAIQFVLAERDVLKTRLEERPLRPLELREEIDQLLAEGEALLSSDESTMIGEADLWFDDVERFARRHLSPSQYDQLHAASLPDEEAAVEQSGGESKTGRVLQEESAIAGRLKRISAGLRELRQGIRG